MGSAGEVTRRLGGCRIGNFHPVGLDWWEQVQRKLFLWRGLAGSGAGWSPTQWAEQPEACVRRIQSSFPPRTFVPKYYRGG